MPSNDTYVPKHRGAAAEPALKKGIKKGVLFSGIAVVTTGVAVSSGVALESSGQPTDAAAAALTSSPRTKSTTAADAVVDRDRSQSPSRSDRRTSVDEAKTRLLSQDSGGQLTKTEDLASGDPRDIARAMLAEFGWSQDQFGCLDSLWSRESGWRTTANNPSSAAYGIPQALPGSKMASAGPDWEYNPETQIRWGLGYIAGRYGNPCGAWGHSQSSGWY